MIENNKTMKSGEKLGKEQQQSAITTTKERENRKRKAVAEIPISGFSKNFQIPFFCIFLKRAKNNNSNNNINQICECAFMCVLF